jgi:putative endonuclease
MKHYYVYVLTNKDNRVLYVGVTNDLIRRMHEHRGKLIEGFTKRYNVNKLVYFEESHDIKEAIATEKRIKGWLRGKKIALINSKNPEWIDLFLILQEYAATDGLGRDSSLHSE